MIRFVDSWKTKSKTRGTTNVKWPQWPAARSHMQKQTHTPPGPRESPCGPTQSSQEVQSEHSTAHCALSQLQVPWNKTVLRRSSSFGVKLQQHRIPILLLPGSWEIPRPFLIWISSIAWQNHVNRTGVDANLTDLGLLQHQYRNSHLLFSWMTSYENIVLGIQKCGGTARNCCDLEQNSKEYR